MRNKLLYQDTTRYKIVYSAIFFLSAITVLMIFSVPVLAEGNRFSSDIAGFIKVCFWPVCHQIFERSFKIFNHSLAVCSRCTGIYTGFLTGVILFPFIRGLRKGFCLHRNILLMAIVLLGVDVFLNWLELLHTGLLIHSITGFLSGIVVVFFVIPGIFELSDILVKKVRINYG